MPLRADRWGVVNAMRSTLLAGLNADGGWGYVPSGASRLEPTIWAMLALDYSVVGNPFLLTLEDTDGLLKEPAAPPNVGCNALVAMALAEGAHVRGSVGFATLVSALSHHVPKPSAASVSPKPITCEWQWSTETDGWVEPTCWCVLALKKVARAATLAVNPTEIEEVERVLIDRACATGGWDSGHGTAPGDDLLREVPATAMALLALQDKRAHPTVEAGLTYLWESRTRERWGMALALAAICLNLYGRPVDDVQDALVDRFERTSFLGNHQVIAMALYALSAPEHEFKPFRL